MPSITWPSLSISRRSTSPPTTASIACTPTIPRPLTWISSVNREYELAHLWLAQTDPKAPADKKLPWYAHFDNRMPLIDSQGLGLKALEHVRQYQPDGPLADDAAIQIADFHMKHRDYESAALYYDQFIAEYGPRKSPFLQDAQLAAIDARMKGYLGPEYDGAGLEKARELDQGNDAERSPNARPPSKSCITLST